MTEPSAALLYRLSTNLAHYKISPEAKRFTELADYLALAPGATVTDRLALAQMGLAQLPRHGQLILASDFRLFVDPPYCPPRRGRDLFRTVSLLGINCREYEIFKCEAELQILKACYLIGLAETDFSKFRNGTVSLSSNGIKPLLSLRVANLLKSYGVFTLEDLVVSRLTASELWSIPGLGPKGFDEICRTLAYFGEEKPKGWQDVRRV